MPWIILTVISLIFDVIQIIGNMVNADHAAWVGGLFFFAIGCYIFIVVWSHRYSHSTMIKTEIIAINQIRIAYSVSAQ